jgi:hypothetical protein
MFVFTGGLKLMPTEEGELMFNYKGKANMITGGGKPLLVERKISDH